MRTVRLPPSTDRQTGGFLLAPAFFPSDDPAASTVAALAVFGTAYIVRPLGGLFFGRLGDRRGRRTALVATILSMCVFSALIGVLPTHEQIGVAAPLLLVLLRLGQGFAAGGEVMGAMTYVLESAPAGRRGRYTGLVPMGSSLGFAVAALVVGLVTATVPADTFASMGWRIPFLLSLPLGLVCLWMRLRLEDSVEFTAFAQSHSVARTPVREALRAAPLALLRVAAYTLALSVVAHVVLVYVGVVMIQQLGFARSEVYWSSAVVIALGATSAPLFGALSDRIGRRPVMVGAALGTAVLFVPLYFALTTTSHLLVAAAVFLGLMVLAQSFSPGYTVFVESFPTRVRYTASALGYNVGILFAGFAPAISAQLVQTTAQRRAGVGPSTATQEWLVTTSWLSPRFRQQRARGPASASLPIASDPSPAGRAPEASRPARLTVPRSTSDLLNVWLIETGPGLAPAADSPRR